jgi:homoserine O-acetyltransferase/O-succinyltransferase
VDIDHLSQVLGTFLAVKPGVTAAPAPAPARRADYALISTLIREHSRVLDLGCGDGELLALLAAARGTSGLGVEIDLENLIGALGRGLDVFQGDIDEGLDMIPDQAYDYVVLSQTLQVVRRPREVLREMLRVAREGIVSFPNFAHWSNRAHLWLNGRMPKTSSLPFEWYDTPNIHLATLHDFMDLCRKEGIRVTHVIPLGECRISRLLVTLGLANLGAERVLVKIARA